MNWKQENWRSNEWWQVLFGSHGMVKWMSSVWMAYDMHFNIHQMLFFFSRKNLEGSHGMAMVEQICCFFRCVWLSSVYFDHNCSPNWIFILFMWQTDHIGRNHISLHMFASWQRHKIEKCLRRAEALLYCNKYLMLISNQLTAHKFYFDQMHFFRNIKNFDRNHHSWMTVTFMWWTFDFFSSSI